MLKRKSRGPGAECGCAPSRWVLPSGRCCGFASDPATAVFAVLLTLVLLLLLLRRRRCLLLRDCLHFSSFPPFATERQREQLHSIPQQD
jgi:MYXO-CTERM domain-containing protein